MRTVTFDGRTGASGDMILGALLAIGADKPALRPIERTLDLTFSTETISTNGLSATKVTVTRDSEPVENAGPHRTLAEVNDIVTSIDVSESAKQHAKSTFTLLANAEGNVHDEAPEAVHFHEVGADDAIADILGAAVLLDSLDLDAIYTTPIATGSGELTMEHGTYPIPPPAVTYLAESASWAIYGGTIEEELLTPTGAAILAHFADGIDAIPTINLISSGYGAGSRTFPSRPNVLNALLGTQPSLERDPITVLETTVDDVSPEILGSLHDTLRPHGARDVSIIPLSMKKSRPGHLVKVITKPETADAVARALAEETGTLGIRETTETHRWIANREYHSINLTIDSTTYSIDVKIGKDTAGKIYDISAEYDDAKEIAEETGHPIREIMRKAETKFTNTNEQTD